MLDQHAPDDKERIEYVSLPHTPSATNTATQRTARSTQNDAITQPSQLANDKVYEDSERSTSIIGSFSPPRDASVFLGQAARSVDDNAGDDDTGDGDAPVDPIDIYDKLYTLYCSVDRSTHPHVWIQLKLALFAMINGMAEQNAELSEAMQELFRGCRQVVGRARLELSGTVELFERACKEHPKV